MSPAMGKCNKIRQIVRIRQMLRRWRRKAAAASSNRLTGGRVPSDVPAGHVAVCVGSSSRRFVVRATYLNHPIFKNLLVQAAEEYGFTNPGPLAIPCDESVFEEVLRLVSLPDPADSDRYPSLEELQRCCHVGAPESRPLLNGFAEKSIC
ncbi:auxin-induced protein 6B-like [Malania oleifera]|uniref:auxin-induced protein 6B-like n=1 Tax=Malania oleifera TaxID=397392 RepID=UPI0025AEAB98|nr:auxin-induced protein 6B-like [Malania oleifera]